MTGKCPDRDSLRWEVCADHEYEVYDFFSLEACQNQLSANPHLIPPHSFLSLSWILEEEAEMEMSWLPAIGGNPLPYRQQKRVKKNERQTKQKWEKTLNTRIWLLKK